MWAVREGGEGGGIGGIGGGGGGGGGEYSPKAELVGLCLGACVSQIKIPTWKFWAHPQCGC